MEEEPQRCEEGRPHSGISYHPTVLRRVIRNTIHRRVIWNAIHGIPYHSTVLRTVAPYGIRMPLDQIVRHYTPPCLVEPRATWNPLESPEPHFPNAISDACVSENFRRGCFWDFRGLAFGIAEGSILLVITGSSTRGSRVLKGSADLTSQKAFIKSFCKSQFPHTSVNGSFIISHKEKVDEFVRELTFAERLDKQCV